MAKVTRHAVSRGAMQPVDTVQEEIEDGGVRFLVRRASSLARKAELFAPDRTAKPVDPFLPYDPLLFVAHASQTHSILLNKFPVLDHHLLVVTRAFEHQETLLNTADFSALAVCMSEGQALGFYNGGREAGASQDHKHIQMVPMPLASGQRALPIESLFRRAEVSGPVGVLAGLPFRHAYAPLGNAIWERPQLAGEALTAAYRNLCRASGIEEREVHGERRQSAPYNLLLTREWMLLIPRRRERYASISVNALGFAGSLFVKDAAELKSVQSAGPMHLLREVATPG